MTDVLFYCMLCDQQIEAPPDMVGERVSCPTCEVEIEVPQVRLHAGEGGEEEVNFNCPHCTHNIDAPSRATGAMVRCPACNGRILIPGRVEPIETAEEVESAPPAPPPAADPSTKGATQRIDLPVMPPPPPRHMKIKRRTD